MRLFLFAFAFGVIGAEIGMRTHWIFVWLFIFLVAIPLGIWFDGWCKR